MSRDAQPMTSDGERKSRHWEALKNRAHLFTDVLDKNQFTVQDFDLPVGKTQSALFILKHSGAIREVAKKKVDSSDKPVIKWEWKQHKDDIKTYLKNRNGLPCGCRSHVPAHTDDKGRYICKFCGSKHSRDVIKNAL